MGKGILGNASHLPMPITNPLTTLKVISLLRTKSLPKGADTLWPKKIFSYNEGEPHADNAPSFYQVFGIKEETVFLMLRLCLGDLEAATL